jgi:uncharacterized repeat protein (TIGR04052 family)
MNIKLTFYLLSLLVLFIFLSACSPVAEKERQHSLSVSVWYKGKPLACNGFNAEKQNFLNIQQLAFFVSKLSLKRAQQSYALNLVPSDWQTSDIALIRPYLQDCDSAISAREPSSDEYNPVLLFSSQISLLDADTLAFELSVPFALNHQNPLVQPSPLNLPSMFWSWRSGHKFFRMDLQSTQGNWAFHLGSVGCEAASSVRAPGVPCKQPNRLAFNLSKNKAQQGSQLILHLDRLLEGIALRPSAACLFHGLSEDTCDRLLSNMQENHIFEWY